MIAFTRAAASSPDTLMVSAVLDEEHNDEAIYEAAARVFQYEHKNDPDRRWYFDDLDLSVQSIAYINDTQISPPSSHFSLLGAEGDVCHIVKPSHSVERIKGAGTAYPESKFYGKVFKLIQIEDRLYVCGSGGQIYVRRKYDSWGLLTDAVIFDPDAHVKLMENAPNTEDPGFLEWLLKTQEEEPRNLFFNDVKGLSKNEIYLCGEEGVKPVLCYWDGSKIHEINVYLPEAALTGIYIENSDSVWVCGREGVLLHGSYARGFAPVSLNTQLNLFHMITPYRGKLVMPASVRPGGLYEYDPKTGDFGKFDPPLPRLRSRDDPKSIDGGPFFAQAVGDVLWVVASKDIFRFDGKEWERIDHPDL
ncbi:hypothetical protein [Allorhizobium taibaishanense]|uniref:WG repeat-containing protein n=2 Tax=Allorhizobium taibaishanense TaxID=887144 RepID=A0A7W6MWT2_9HYPH|nr:hypothetical protein [Allorhizobium taibaishanense]MBB4010564.1 hypothetical protein [Allorhizobium taibaishanense]